MLRDPDDAYDAVQEACLRAWRHFAQLQPGASARPWFLTIVANQCRTLLRAKMRRRLGMLRPRPEPRSPDIIAVERSDLSSALQRLHPDHRAVLFLRYYLDLDVSDTAVVLRTSESAVKSRAVRALAEIRQHLGNG